MDHVEGQTETTTKVESTNQNQSSTSAKAEDSNNGSEGNDILKRLEQLESSKERLESESKKWKSRYQELEQTNTQAMQKRLEEEGKFQELLQLEREKRAELETRVRETKKYALQKELRAEVSRYAKDAFDIDDVVSNLDKGMISVDEENFTINGIKEAVAKVKETKSYLFERPGMPGQFNGRPSGTPKKKTLSELNSAEKLSTLKDLLGQ